MTTFYATFGTGQEYSRCYVTIIAEGHHAARAHMIREHGDRWSSALYEADEFDELSKRFDLIHMVTVRQRSGEGPAVFDVVRMRAGNVEKVKA